MQLGRKNKRQQERRADSERDRAERAESLARAEKVGADRKHAKALIEKQVRQLTTFGLRYAKSCKEKKTEQVREYLLNNFYGLDGMSCQ